MSSVTFSRAVSVECPARYADCIWQNCGEFNRCGCNFINASLSTIFDNVDKFVIDLKLASIAASSPCLFMSGFTCQNFIKEGNTPALNDAFAMFAIISDISGRHNFNNDVGMISRGDDLFDIFKQTFSNT